jgi:hypothetical protein
MANNLSNPMRWLLPPATMMAESTVKGVTKVTTSHNGSRNWLCF